MAPLRRLTATQYAASIQDLFRGQVTASTRFPSPTLSISLSGFSTDPEANTVTQLAAEDILRAAEDAAVEVAEKLPALLPCATAAADASCAGLFLDDYGARALRRPLTEGERSQLLGLFTTFAKDGFEVGIAAITTALLQLPQFLYLVEIGPKDAPSGTVSLTAYEKAARLSFLFHEALPDAALVNAAQSGALDTPLGLTTEARRLLSDARASTALTRFFREWTAFRQFPATSRLPIAPNFTESLQASIQEQFDRFASESVLGADPSVEHLFTSRAFPLNGELAAFYGVPAPEGPGFTNVVLAPEHGAGILALPALLGGHSHETETSIIFRGKFGLTKLLCIDLPSPPPGATSEAPEAPANATPRERSLGIRANPTCAACHSMLDPMGLGFEDFDAVGRHRTQDEHGNPVDSLGQLPSGTPFNGVAELGALVATDPAVHECLAKQWFRFTFSRKETAADACTIESVKSALALPARSLEELMLGIVASPAFSKRLVRDAAN